MINRTAGISWRGEMIMSEEVELSVGDRVRHADAKDSVGAIVRLQAYPMVTVRWESTGRESSENMHLLVPLKVHVVSAGRGSHVLMVNGEEYGDFGEESNANAAADYWQQHLTSGGHPLTDDERRYSRRDTYPVHGITFREHLGEGGYLPDLWEIFQFGARVGRYTTERGALKRIERLREETRED